nr:flagellar biosynthesis protein FlhF [Campylobacter sp.]
MIKQESFTGTTPLEAMQRAKEKLGDNAQIVTTKQIREKTLNQSPLYEIIVAVEVSDEAPQTRQEASVNDIKRKIQAYTRNSPTQSNFNKSNYQRSNLSSANDEDVSLNISKVAKEIRQIANIPETNTPDYTKELSDIRKQILQMNKNLSILADSVWNSKIEEINIVIPPEFASIYKQAKESGMKPQHLEQIMTATIENMPTTMKSDPTAVKRYFYSFLRRLLPCRKENINLKKRKIIMLVGPTGVGKTTTLSKLAYKFAHGDGTRYKTGLITLDSYRIGAVEQLFQYASIMNLQIIEVLNPDEFGSAIKQYYDKDLILIDTVGSSQYDQKSLEKLSEFLKASEEDVDVSLVLSAGSKIEDLLEIYENYSFLKIDSLIITKFDETKIFGNVFSLIYETKTPVSYFSIGQNVPEDIMEADEDYLIKCILEGFDAHQKGISDGSSQ